MVAFIDRTGQIFNNIKIVKELGGGKVETICIKCGYLDTHNKYSVVSEQAGCKGCNQYGIKNNTIGKTFNMLEVIEELCGDKVKCECKECGATNDYKKSYLIKGKLKCSYCYTKYKCIKCGTYIFYKNSKRIDENKLICKNCINKEKSKLKLKESNSKFSINKKADYEILGEKYYKCKCNSCNKIMILSIGEMKKHKC